MKMLVALLAITTICALNTVPAAAQNGAFCLRGCDFGYSNCTFASYQQCQATASGLTAWCEANPFFHQASDVQRTARISYSRRRL